MRKKLRAAVVLAGLVLTWSLAQAQVLAVYPNPVQFGTVPLNSPSYSIAVFLSNINAGAIDVTGITISGTNSHDFTFAQACIGTIPVNNSCEMFVTFTPSAMGARSANLLITVTGVTSAISVPLAGTGGNPIPAVTSLSPASIYLGSAAVTVTINGAGFLP